ncbi:MAG: hypothetical protein Q8942_10400, partial [Bacillota bacterium]|nr:hypothetical protein [Bacillota bacterium]
MKNNDFEFNNISKLTERDRDINILSDFLKQLHSKKRGILRIVSNQGSGATSFLNIASNIALKHNYEVININGYSDGKSIDKLKTRNINDLQNLKSHLYKKIIDSKKDGQIIIIDIIDQIDNDTLS